MNKCKCPVCGHGMTKRAGGVTFPVKRHKIRVDNVVYWQCISCREKVFDHAAQEVIEKTVYGRKKAHAA